MLSFEGAGVPVPSRMLTLGKLEGEGLGAVGVEPPLGEPEECRVRVRVVKAVGEVVGAMVTL